MSRLLDDQPQGSAGDRLRFGEIVEALERQVLRRESREPYVVGLFGPWGCGKSSLLKMLAERMREDRDGRWCVVEFSPWAYRNEKSLLLPLLTKLTKHQPAFENLVKWMVEHGPEAVEKLSNMGFEAATTGLPLLSLLGSLNDKQNKGKELTEQLEDAVKQATGNGSRLVFLIDDLDRCHDSAQIIGLLEQIKLFLHFPNCLFFIAADRAQIVRAIEDKFKGEGRRYLDKFVQLALELPPAHGVALLDVIPAADADRFVMLRVAEALDSNPRRIKLLWNRVVICHAVLDGNEYERSLPLLLKWLLLRESGLFERNPLDYLELEALADVPDFRERRAQFNEKLKQQGFHADEKNPPEADACPPWRSRFHQRLAFYLWQDLDNHRYENPANLMRYVRATGQVFHTDRRHLEALLFEGRNEFRHYPLKLADLRHGHFPGAHFIDCELQGVDFSDANLQEAIFENCNIAGARFDGARLEGVTWKTCRGFHRLQTRPEAYEALTDAVLEQWRSDLQNPPIQAGNEDEIFKAYAEIYRTLEAAGRTPEELQPLKEKYRRVKEEADRRINL
jgi:energy-coupling factor transporter ATP-binding protein EcfA2